MNHRLALLLTLCAAPAVFPLSPANAAEPTRTGFFTPERLEALPASQMNEWQSYLTHSNSLLKAERDQLALEATPLAPIKAPTAKDFKIKEEWAADWFKTADAARLAQTMISFQTPSGGWSKAVDYTRGSRAKGMAWTSQSSPIHYAATFDNRSTTEQIVFLNDFFAATGNASARAAIERGLDYIFAAQYPNGGWPQTFPLEGGYHDAITFNDDAITHILELLRSISNAQPKWQWLDAARRDKANAALSKGTECILNSQVVQGTHKTVWCAQEDPLTLKPVAARLKEPASLSGGESVGLVRFLMNQTNPTPSVVDAINGALGWFEQVKIKEADGSVKWARFYDVRTNTPLFAGADDGIIYPTFEAMAAKNRLGYDYFVTTPQKLLEKDAPLWRQ